MSRRIFQRPGFRGDAWLIPGFRKSTRADQIVGGYRLAPLNPRQKRVVKRLIRGVQELKWFQASLADQVINSTGVVVGVTDIPQGDTDQTRDGDQIKLVGSIKLHAKLSVDLGNDALQQTPLIRFAVIQWHPQTTSGGADEPTLAAIFNAGPSGSVDVLSNFNHDNRQLFKVLYNKWIRLVGPGTATTNAYNPLVEKFIMKNISLRKAHKKMQYSAGSSVIATNHIYVLYLADVGSDAQNPTITWSTKIVYTDS